MGDLNARVGQPRVSEYLIIKSNGYGIRNPGRQGLVDFESCIPGRRPSPEEGLLHSNINIPWFLFNNYHYIL